MRTLISSISVFTVVTVFIGTDDVWMNLIRIFAGGVYV